MNAAWQFGWDQLFNGLTAVGVIFATLVALRGLNSWKTEKITSRRIDAAEQALALIYESEWIFQRIRSPAGWAAEGSSRTGSADESESEKKLLDQSYVPVERIRKEEKFFSQISEIRPTVKVLFGDKGDKFILNILAFRHEVFVAAHLELITARDRAFGFADKSTREMLSKQEEIKWDTGKENKLTQRISDNISDAEKYFLKLIRGDIVKLET